MQVANLFSRLGLKVDRSQFATGMERLNATRLAAVALTTVVGTKLILAFRDAAVETLSFGEAVKDLSLRTGQSTDFLQKLAFAAGGGAEGLSKAQGALDKFGVRLREAVENPANDTAQALKALGISVNDPRVRLGNLEAIMQEVADKFEQMPSGAEKNAIAFGLMSKSGLEMSKVLTELNEKAGVLEASGGLLSQAEIDKADEMQDKLEAMGASWQAVKNTVVMSIVPGLLDAFDKVKKWFNENKEALAEGVGVAFDVLKGAIETLAETIKDNKEVVLGFFAAWGVVLAAPYVKLLLIVTAVRALMYAFTWVGQGIGKVLAMIVLGLEDLGEWWDETTEGISENFSKSWDALKKGWNDVVDAIAPPFVAAWDVVKGAFDSVFSKIEAIYNKVKGWVDDMIEAADYISGGEDDRQNNMRRQESLQAQQGAAKMARKLLDRGESEATVRSKVEGVYGKADATIGLRQAQNVTVNAAPITVTINGANETPENLGLLFQRKVQEAQGVMLRDAAATLGGAI